MFWMLRLMYHSHQHQLLPPTLLQCGEGSQDSERKTRGAGNWWRDEQPPEFARIPSSVARHDGGTSETVESVSSVIRKRAMITTHTSCMSEHYKWQVYPGG